MKRTFNNVELIISSGYDRELFGFNITSRTGCPAAAKSTAWIVPICKPVESFFGIFIKSIGLLSIVKL